MKAQLNNLTFRLARTPVRATALRQYLATEIMKILNSKESE
jgi:hypothetical protein